MIPPKNTSAKEFHKHPERFQWCILFTGEQEEIDQYELDLIWENREYLPLNLNYTAAPTFRGHKHSEEAKKRISDASRQKKIKRQLKGLPRFSPEAQQRMKQANTDKKGKYPSPLAGTGGSIYTCETCGQKFKAGPASKRKYCSQKCYSVNRPKSGLKRESICPVCHKSFISVRKDKAKDIWTLYCSYMCTYSIRHKEKKYAMEY
jgi:hypothetical protein